VLAEPDGARADRVSVLRGMIRAAFEAGASGIVLIPMPFT
jgi:hypothetical protein